MDDGSGVAAASDRAACEAVRSGCEERLYCTAGDQRGAGLWARHGSGVAAACLRPAAYKAVIRSGYE